MLEALRNNLSLLQFSILQDFPGILHFTTTRPGGVSKGNYASLNLGLNSGDHPHSVTENRLRLCSSLDISLNQLVFAKQTHSVNIRYLDSGFLRMNADEKKSFLADTDAIITGVKGLCIAVKTADCVPVLLYDSKKKIIAAVHAGWRGTIQNIVSLTIEKMKLLCSSEPKDIAAGIGPSISPEVYEVGTDVWKQFSPAFLQINGKGGDSKRNLDLPKANAMQLADAGIPSNQIEISGKCTFSEPSLFFSARRDGPQTGRMATGIMLI